MEKGYKHTEVGVIPEDWEVKTLGEIGDFKKGKNIPKSSILEYGVPCVLYGEIYTKYNFYSSTLYSKTSIEVAKSSTKIQSGDVLFSGSGETAEEIGKCFTYIGKDDAYAGGDIIIFTSKVSESLFLGFLLNCSEVVRQKSFMGQGSSVYHIYPNNLKKILIPLPPTKAEQTAIATVLSDADALIQKLEQLIAKKRNIKTGAMQELLKPKEGWEVKKLGEIAEITKGQLITEKTAVPDGIPVIGGGMTISYYHNKPNRKGVTITVSASGAYAGYVSIHNYPIFASDCSTIKESEQYDSYFLYFALLNKQKEIYSLQTGGGQPHVYPQQLRDLFIPIPKQKHEQTRIAQILSDMDNEIQALEKQLEKYKMIKQGMMQCLLTGRIRLNQDFQNSGMDKMKAKNPENPEIIKS